MATLTTVRKKLKLESPVSLSITKDDMMEDICRALEYTNWLRRVPVTARALDLIASRAFQNKSRFAAFLGPRLYMEFPLVVQSSKVDVQDILGAHRIAVRYVQDALHGYHIVPTEQDWLEGMVTYKGNRMKIGKFLDGTALRYYNSLRSQLANMGNLKVVLSAKPDDIFLMSESAIFTSCHRAHASNPGEYIRGTFANMVDDTTMMAYAYLEKEGHYPKKTWRQMIYLDSSAKGVVFSKQYPGPHTALSKAAMTTLLEAMKKAGDHKSDAIPSAYAVSGNKLSFLDNSAFSPYLFPSPGKTRVSINFTKAAVMCVVCGDDTGAHTSDYCPQSINIKPGERITKLRDLQEIEVEEDV